MRRRETPADAGRPSCPCSSKCSIQNTFAPPGEPTLDGNGLGKRQSPPSRKTTCGGMWVEMGNPEPDSPFLQASPWFYLRLESVVAPIAAVLAAASQVILGKEREIRLALACLLAQSHPLIEDIPGVGAPTTSPTPLARLLGLEFSRIQFHQRSSRRILPASRFFDRDSGSFASFPVRFSASSFWLTKSTGLPQDPERPLEAMEERQVTAEGETRSLPAPFSSSPPRIRPTRSVPFLSCPSRSSTASSCAPR